jgi:hypothetical protein
MRFSSTWPISGGATPAGHRPVLREGIDEDDPVALLHDVEEGGRAPAGIVIERVDLVGHDPEVMPPGDGEQVFEVRARRRPAGRVRRRVDEEHARLRRDRRLDAVEIDLPAPVGKIERHGNGIGPGKLGRCREIRPGRCQVDHVVPRRDERLYGKLDRLHARADRIEMLGRQRRAEAPRIIARQRRPKLGNPALPGIESLSPQQRVGRRARDEFRRRQVPFADPERD